MKVNITLGTETTEHEISNGMGVKVRYPGSRMLFDAKVLQTDEAGQRLFLKTDKWQEWVGVSGVRAVLTPEQVEQAAIQVTTDLANSDAINAAVAESGYASDTQS